MILKQTGSTIMHAKEAHQVIKKEFIPILQTCFEPKSNDFIGCNYFIKKDEYIGSGQNFTFNHENNNKPKRRA